MQYLQKKYTNKARMAKVDAAPVVQTTHRMELILKKYVFWQKIQEQIA